MTHQTTKKIPQHVTNSSHWWHAMMLLHHVSYMTHPLLTPIKLDLLSYLQQQQLYSEALWEELQQRCIRYRLSNEILR